MRVLEAGADAAGARLAVIMMHGRGRMPEEMAALGAAFAVEGVRYLCPEAPGQTWYPGRFLDEVATNQPALAHALGVIDGLVASLLEAGRPPGRIVLCGFSQGACLVAQYLVERPRAFGAGLIFTGGLIGPPGTAWPVAGRLDGVPVLVTGGEVDDWVPAWRTRETAAFIAGLGAAVTTAIYADRPHEVCDDEIARARALLAGLN